MNCRCMHTSYTAGQRNGAIASIEVKEMDAHRTPILRPPFSLYSKFKSRPSRIEELWSIKGKKFLGKNGFNKSVCMRGGQNYPLKQNEGPQVLPSLDITL